MARLQSGEAAFPENPLIHIQALAMSRSFVKYFVVSLSVQCLYLGWVQGGVAESCSKFFMRIALARWFGLTERAPRFMSRSEASEIYAEGMELIKWHWEAGKVLARPGWVQKRRFNETWVFHLLVECFVPRPLGGRAN